MPQRASYPRGIVLPGLFQMVRAESRRSGTDPAHTYSSLIRGSGDVRRSPALGPSHPPKADGSAE